MMTKSSRYALRAVLHLAERGANVPVPVDDVAAVLDVPRNYLSKVLHVLACEGILRSTRGPHGGFELGRDPARLHLAEVMEAFEPLDGPAVCLLGRTTCAGEDACNVHTEWKEVARSVHLFFRDTTVAALAAPPQPTQP